MVICGLFQPKPFSDSAILWFFSGSEGKVKDSAKGSSELRLISNTRLKVKQVSEWSVFCQHFKFKKLYFSLNWKKLKAKWHSIYHTFVCLSPFSLLFLSPVYFFLSICISRCPVIKTLPKYIGLQSIFSENRVTTMRAKSLESILALLEKKKKSRPYLKTCGKNVHVFSELCSVGRGCALCILYRNHMCPLVDLDYGNLYW